MERDDKVGALHATGLFMLGFVGTIIGLIAGVVWAMAAPDRKQRSMAMCMSLGSVVGTVLVPVMAVAMYFMVQAPTP